MRHIPVICLLMLAFAAPAHAQTTVEIWEIQGAGPESPFVDQRVETGPNVVTAVGARGFFMQTPPDRTDGDEATSDGIYVFNGPPPEVQAGDLVVVSGMVVEFFENTEFDRDGLSIEVVGSADLPEPITLVAPFPAPEPPSEFERYEGMLVRVTGAESVAGTRLYYEGQPREETEVAVVYGAERAFREPGIPYPGEGSNLQIFDNNPEVFEFGFGGGANSADFATLSDPVHPGATLSGSGPVIYRFGRYQVWPLAGTLDVDTGAQMDLPRPAPQADEGLVSVGTQNVENLFDTQRDPGKEDDPVTDEALELKLGKVAAQICEVLGAPDIVALQEVEKIDLLADPDGGPDLTTAIEEVCGVVYTPYLVEGNDVRGIDNAYLVTERVEVGEVSALGPADLFSRPPLLMEATVEGLPLVLINVHNKSYGDSERDFVRERRYRQAVFLAETVQAQQAANRSVNLIVLGDFNAFAFNDGLAPSVQIVAGQAEGENPGAIWWPDADLVEPNLIIQTKERVPEAERYSYIFDGSAQVLDHILTSQALDPYVVEVAFTRGNADAPFNYEDEPGSPLASSDHDGAVLLLDPSAQPAPAESSGTGVLFPLLGLLIFMLIIQFVEGRGEGSGGGLAS